MKEDSVGLFFALLRAGLWEKDVELQEFGATDFNEIMRLAEEQAVVGLVTAGLERVKDVKVPQETLLQFIGSTLQIEQQNKDMNAFVARLIDIFRKEGVYSTLVKGQGIAQCYERPLWRSCGDVDLFLSDTNFENAKKFLTPLASNVEQEYVREKHIGMTIDGWVVELHGRLFSGLSSRIERELDEVLRDTFYSGAVRSWNNDGVQVFLLKAENDVFYVFTHILQHFFKEGLGMRQVCDWCRLLWTYRDKLDLNVVESRVRRSGLMSEWRAFGAYAVEYLGMPMGAMPFYSDGSRWKKNAKRINEFILNVGNMGHNRDTSYMKYPFIIRKMFSAGRRFGDLVNHARLYPLDSLKFSFAIMKNGLRSAIKGEG